MRTQLFESSGSHRSLITQAPNPELVKRQAQSFIGYTYSDSQWIPWACLSGASFSETKPFGPNYPGYGDCCTATLKVCYPWTTCVTGTLYGSAGSYPCGPGFSCESAIVASSEGAELEGALWIYCGTASGIYYRTLPSAAPSITPTVVTNIGPSSSQTSQSNSPTITSNSPLSMNNSSTTSTTGAAGNQTTSQSRSNISGATIAGAVVGPICGVALLLGLVFLFLRERRRKPPAANVSLDPQPQPPPPGPVTSFKYYTADKPELDAVNAPHSPHPVSIPPAYPGTEQVETTAAMNYMPSPTMPHGAELDTHSPMPIGQQSGPQVQQQIQSQQVPARRPVMAELGTNPQVTGMPPELPTSTGYFVNTV